MRAKRWQTYLETIDDVLDWEVHRDKGEVTFFSINYRTRIEDRWIEVIRYDACHGFLHMHRFWRPEPDQATPLSARRISVQNYRAAFKAAGRDLEANWDRYRRLTLASL